MKQRIDFFVVGAQKAGTTALHYHLSKHPALFLPRVKETHFFDDGHGEYHKGVEHYLRAHYSDAAADQMAGEVDPEYLFFPQVAERLARHFPASKLIFLFREPVARAYSHYLMSYSRGIELLELSAALDREDFRLSMRPEDIDPTKERVPYIPPAVDESHRAELFQHVVQSDFAYVNRSRYARQVEVYLRHFPREQMLFLLSEDLLAHPEEAMTRVYDFLAVPYLAPRSLQEGERNAASAPRLRALQDFLLDPSSLKGMIKPFLPSALRRRLKSKLLQFNREIGTPPVLGPDLKMALQAKLSDETGLLENLIGRRLQHWRAS